MRQQFHHLPHEGHLWTPMPPGSMQYGHTDMEASGTFHESDSGSWNPLSS